MSKNQKLFKFVLAALFTTLIVVMTVIPQLGYINYGLIIEITTIHIAVIIGAVFLGWKYGVWLGFVWGLTCVIRALILSGIEAYVPFINPMVSLVPRVIVGFVAGILPSLFAKTKMKEMVSIVLTAIIATLSNTVLVLSMYWVFTGMIKSVSSIFEMFKNIILTIAGINGIIEIVAAAILTPVVFFALKKVMASRIHYQ